jgi:alkylhydroperoxidase family enzyme
MLGYVDKLTRTPASMTASDVEALRQSGFNDAAILDICQVAAYYAFVNRIAQGLGVELENDVASGANDVASGTPAGRRVDDPT